MKNNKVKLVIIIMLLVLNHPNLIAKNIPKRIVSLGPALTERVFLLNSGDNLIGNTTYCLRPQEAIGKEKIGSVVEADIEKILSLEPDLVLAISLTNPKLIKKMKQLGLRVEFFKQPSNFSELLFEFRRLGKILGREQEAIEISKKVEKAINEIKQRSEGLSKPKVFVQIGANPLFTATKKSFVNDFIKYSGAVNIADKAKSGMYSREKVLEQNPDIILIVTMGIVGQQEKEQWLKYPALNAVKNNRIHILESYKICSPSPVGLIESISDVFTLIHPEPKQKNE